MEAWLHEGWEQEKKEPLAVGSICGTQEGSKAAASVLKQEMSSQCCEAGDRDKQFVRKV